MHYYERDMYTEKNLKEKLTYLFENDPCLHISIYLAKPPIEWKNVSVKLVGVYRHIFQIEREKNGKTERYSLQYGDIVAGIVKISEL